MVARRARSDRVRRSMAASWGDPDGHEGDGVDRHSTPPSPESKPDATWNRLIVRADPGGPRGGDLTVCARFTRAAGAPSRASGRRAPLARGGASGELLLLLEGEERRLLVQDHALRDLALLHAFPVRHVVH